MEGVGREHDSSVALPVEDFGAAKVRLIQFFPPPPLFCYCIYFFRLLSAYAQTGISSCTPRFFPSAIGRVYFTFTLRFLPLTLPNAGYNRRNKHKAYKEISARVMGCHIGLGDPCGCIHILLISQAKWDAVWAQADQHDRERKGATLPPPRSSRD